MEINSIEQIVRMVDISVVRTDVTKKELDEIIEACKEYKFICAFAMPCYTQYLVEQLAECKEIMVGGVVGFPSGADTTAIKVQAAQELMKMGVDELDMVINVGMLKSGNYDYVYNDIKAIVDTAQGMPVKVILEICYLSEEEIRVASEIAVRAGVTYVKTGTGWGNKPTKVEHIKIIKEVVGDKALIKAAGGVRTLNDVVEMTKAGCNRFGIGLNSVENIIKEFEEKNK